MDRNNEMEYRKRLCQNRSKESIPLMTGANAWILSFILNRHIVI